MEIYEMRRYVTNAYPGEKWKERCKNMRPGQVMAIYYSMLSRDRDKKKKVNGEKQIEQLTIFDYL